MFRTIGKSAGFFIILLLFTDTILYHKGICATAICIISFLAIAFYFAGLKINLQKNARFNPWYTGTALIFILLLPYLLNGESSFITIPDTMDVFFSRYRILIHNNILLNTKGTVDQIMNGLPREGMLVNGFNVISLLFLGLNPYAAWIANMFLVNIVAFTGMFLLTRKFLIRTESEILIPFITAIFFSFLPFWYPSGISVAGLPLLLYSILNVSSKKHKTIDLVIIALFPFYSFLVFTGVYAIVLLLLFSAYKMSREGSFHMPLAGVVVILCISFAITDWGIISYFINGEPWSSHRETFNYCVYNGFWLTLKGMASDFVFGHIHSPGLQPVIIVTSFLVVVRTQLHEKRFVPEKVKILMILILVAFLISCFYAFYSSSMFNGLKHRLPLLALFEFSRIHWFHPLIWYTVLAISLKIISEEQHLKPVFIVVVFLQLTYIFSQKKELLNNVKIMAGKEVSEPAFDQYFAQGLFGQVSKQIGISQDSYRVGSIGIPPAVLQYNGFYTIDGYANLYPSSYKIRFRQVIAAELDKSPFLKYYFDSWGNKCYIFSSEIDEKMAFYATKKSGLESIHPSLNSQALKDLNCSYIFSSVRLANAKENGLELEGIFRDGGSAWDVYLYRVI